MKYYLELKQTKEESFDGTKYYQLNLSQGGMDIGGCGITSPLTESQLKAMNGILSTLYGLNDPDFMDDNDVKHYQQWASKYVEVLKSRIEVEEEMIKFLEE